MRIELHEGFRGRLTKERLIQPGIYTSEELLRGLAEYLVANGFATELEEPAESFSEVQPNPEPVAQVVAAVVPEPKTKLPAAATPAKRKPGRPKVGAQH